MKKHIFILIMAFVPSLLMAQTAGGQITRKQTSATTTTAKKTQGSTANNKTNSGKRSTTAESPSRKASTGMTQAQKNRIIKNLVNNMVYVAGGTFTMGATSEQGSDAYEDEKPAHRVNLSSFYFGKYEVTQEEWEAVMGSNPSNFKGARRPVEHVSWNDCQEYIRKLNQLTGRQFRLPTEAEWEYAARGGNKSLDYKYAGSNKLGDVAWYGDNSNHQTHDVGQKQPNELGLYDMSGNVWEWCQDWYDRYYYGSSSQSNPMGAYSGSGRVARGSCWGEGAGSCRVSVRGTFSPVLPGGSNLGLRLAY